MEYASEIFCSFIPKDYFVVTITLKMNDARHQRRKQRILLAASLIILAIGIYGIITKGIEWMFVLPSRSMANRFNLPFVILFVLALITAFFTLKNLAGKKKS